MSLALQLELQGHSLGAINRRLQPLINADYSELLETLAAEVVSQTEDRIDIGKSAPDGTPWAALNEKYAERKQSKSDGGILNFGGHLLGTLSGDSDREEAVISMGDNLEYAAIHQLGGAAVGMPWIEARPYLGVSDDNLDDLQALVDHWITDIVEN